MKRIRFNVIDVQHGEGWAVVLMEDLEKRLFVVAWDAPSSAGHQETTTRDVADYFFDRALKRVA